MPEAIAVEWWEFEVWKHWARTPNAWTYRHPIENPRVIFTRWGDVELGRIHKEMDEDGRISYRIAGSKHAFPQLRWAANALYARHSLQGLSNWR
jgi:hypothetical protein